MSGYSSFRNPLLPSPPQSATRSKFFSNISLATNATLTKSISTSSFRGFMTKTMSQVRLGQNRRIMPSGMQKSYTDKPYHLAKSSLENEPLVHYNGPHQTLESLPAEKLNWIKDETTCGTQNPLTDYEQSIVLRKPVTKSQTYPSFTKPTTKQVTKPRAMFYIRILQIVATDSAKTRLFRCGIQVNDETCLSSFVTSEKTGKKSCITHFNETFLFDIDAPTTATINVYAQNKGGNIFQSKSHKQEVCVGKEVIHIPLQPKSKTTGRYVLNSDPKTSQSNDLQLLVVHGTFVSNRTQNMLNDKTHFEDFVTVYTHTGKVPTFDRYWGVLRGVNFRLYDFVDKENKAPIYDIPLDNFINAFSSNEEPEEDMKVDIGSNGLVLQFTEKAIDRRDIDEEEEEEEVDYRMYLLPESSAAAREWEKSFNYVASIFDEMRGWDNSDSIIESEYSTDFNSVTTCSSYEDRAHVPSQLIW